MFPLCRTCCGKESQTKCTCSEEQRAITGTWVIDEILKAVEMGYSLKKVYCVYNYEAMAKNDVSVRPGDDQGLFQDYVRMFLKIKQESSSWPSGTETDEQKDEYIKFYKENQGIELDKERICHNPGLRMTAKIFLNSELNKMK